MTVEPLAPPASDSRPWIGSPSKATGDNLDWARLAHTLWWSRWLLIGVVAGALVLTTLVVRRLPQVFEAEALVMLNPARVQLLPNEIDAGATPVEQLEAEPLKIKSRQLLALLVRQLKLDSLPEFNPALKGDPGPFETIGTAAGQLLAGLLGQQEASPADVGTAIVDDLLDRIDAGLVAGKSILRVSFRAGDPKLAADAVNALVEAYRDARLRTWRADVERAKRFLEGEIPRLRAQLKEANLAIEGYRRDHGILVQASADEQERAGLMARLAAVRGERIDAETRLGQLEGLDPATASARSLLPASAELDELETRRLELERQIAEAARELGSQHPRLANLRAGLASLEQQVTAAVRRQSQNLKHRVEVGRAQETALLSELERVQRSLEQRARAEVDLQPMEQEAAATRALLETYLRRLPELQSELQLQAPLSQLISSAAAPLAPVAPRRLLIFGVVLVAALGVGALVVFLRDDLDKTFRSSEQIEDLVGLPALGLVPLLSTRGRPASAMEQIALQQPASPFGESMCSLRTALAVIRGGRPLRTLLLTSALPGEGKSLTAMCLALTSARGGWRTLVIDCDLHRPRLHELAGVANGPGLSEVLQGQATLSEALLRSDQTGLHLLTAGAPVADAAALLGSETMDRLSAHAAAVYDLVVLDSPPVLSVSDARILAQRADQTVFLVGWGATRRSDVLVGVKQLLEGGAQVGGLLLTQVDARKHARYGYRDSGYYHAPRYTSYLKAA
jgi:capsular exopolysaccharide synthesis family protein